MANTKVPAELSSTPGIIDNSSATAITIDSAGAATFVDTVTADGLTTNTAKLKAIAKDISDTAVDVFVYDTRKDSDGGAWRKRTQHTSWYNETLNTSTRGARKEFPSVAVIVAESLQVTIYDGDDPDMPMWMVFNADSSVGSGVTATSTSISTGKALFHTAGIRTTESLNGQLILGCGNWQVFNFDFVCDKISFHAQYGTFGAGRAVYSNSIVGRDSSGTYSRVSSVGILTNAVNDVAMTVLPNAPIDADTGLPVPTIAVATDGGVSVIKDDGTVVDITHTASTWKGAKEISLNGNQISYASQQSGSSTNYWRRVFIDIPSGDVTGAYTHNIPGTTIYDARGVNANSGVVLNINADLGNATNNIKAAVSDKAVGFSDKLTRLSITDFPGGGVPSVSGSLVAYTTSDYNTGWMHGDIKLATLSDTDTTSVTGSELVVNGTFEANSDWANYGTPTTSAQSTEQVKSGTYSWKIVSDATLEGISQDFSTSLSADTYVLTGSFYSSTGYLRLRWRNNVDNGWLYDANVGDGTANTWQTFSVTKTDTTTGSGMGVRLISNTTVVTMYLDDFSLRLAEQDRSYNNNGLQVFGTITKTAVATGADLVAYSGFTSGQFTGNRLEQPYNSDLAFGTGDFSINFWLKNVIDGYDIMGIGKRNSNFAWTLYKDAGGGLRYTFSTTGTSSSGQIEYQFGDASTIPNWTSVNILRRSGVFHIYINGKLEETLTGNETASLYDPQEPLVIGSGNTNNITDSDVSIALLRISATAPTAEQIAKIYNDEKHLFQENAKATLYGSSDAVTALAYDDDTELLHGGTSAGRSVFQGLNRVDNTTDAVGVAISASNGLVAED